jgi:probable F420-dependent oxidoreductase
MKFVLSTSFVPVSDIAAIAQKADEVGWHGLSFSDHVVHPKKLNTPYPYTQNGERRWDAFTEWPDPMVMIGALASITQRIEFMNNIYVLPMRNPFMAAKAISTAAVLSNNRINLCIGVGWSKDEFQLLEQDFHTRGKRCDEAVTVLRKLMQGGWVKHDGEFYPFDELEMSPTPSEPIPIWVGGISPFALKRAAKIGDGWVSDLQSSEEITASIAEIQKLRQKENKSMDGFQVMASPNDAFMPEQYLELETKGVTHIMTMPWFFYHKPPFTLEQQLDSIERFYHDVIVKSQVNK